MSLQRDHANKILQNLFQLKRDGWSLSSHELKDLLVGTFYYRYGEEMREEGYRRARELKSYYKELIRLISGRKGYPKLFYILDRDLNWTYLEHKENRGSHVVIET